MELDNKNAATKKIKTTKLVYPQIYSYILPEEKDNEGSQKIGYTERKDVNKRVYEQTHTAAKKHPYKILWSNSAFFANSKKDFLDTSFHKFLIKNNIENRLDLGKEWFYFNGTPERSEELFNTFVNQGFRALQTNGQKMPYELRPEQEEAVEKAKNYFETHEKGEFLWNAKPRFGKTLSSYDLAKKLNAKKVLIVTNRPAIANSWFDDYEMFVNDYYFVSDTSSLSERKSLTREQFIAKEDKEKSMITFLSLQDLKGSIYFGGGHDKLSWVADLNWDLLIIDEAHEGVDTMRTDSAFNVVKRKHTLHLSGTPFKALANQKFSDDAIFNWTYLDEQKVKRAEQKINESGAHADLPNLKLYTYRISQMIADEVNEGIEINETPRDFAFDLNEFFATTNQKFDHEEDVKEFLKNLSTNTKYPFSTPELRDELRHTFWYVGNRVDSVKALEQLLKQDEVFKDYKIIVAAGNGKTFEEEEADFKGNEKSFDKVKKAIAENPKTITLSCGQLTTGVTIKEWSAVLMLTDIKTPAQYMQAAFRAQNPYRFNEDGQQKVKKSAYLFDFAPSRVLEIYDQFANGLNGKAVKGEITEGERKENIAELLNFFPVISEDTNGEMVELDAEKVLTFPNALAATEIVKARFMTNLLFNDNIKGVFHFPKQVEEIINKLPKETNKRAVESKTELNLEDARQLEGQKQTKINENRNIILGDKIYRANIERLVDNIASYETPEETLEVLSNGVNELAEETLMPICKKIYKTTNAEDEEIKEIIKEKVNISITEHINSEDKDPQKLKDNLIKIIEEDFVESVVEKKETAIVEEVQKTKEDEVREHLRAFTRTIPMFIMANSSRDEITIDNFDENISDADFVDLTNITKDEFHMLRDGFDYTDDDGERKTFSGVFDKYRFNASIAEFMAEKNKRANYFEEGSDIFELIPNQKNNQIFTPKKVVEMMINDLEREQPDLFTRTDSTFIDLYMKSGMYITEIVKKLFANTRHNYNSDEECIKHILENQVYGLSPTGILQGITQSYIFGINSNYNISNRNFVQHDLLPEAKDGTAWEKISQIFGNGGEMMKFDAVVGNPPYQETSGKSDAQTQGNSSWIYQHFQFSADKIGNLTSLIYPFGGWFDSPSSLTGLGRTILSDGHTVSINAFEGTNDKRAWYRTDKIPSPIFGTGANLSAGVAIVLRNNEHKSHSFKYSNRIYSDKTSVVYFSDWQSLTPNPDFVNINRKLQGPKLANIVKKSLFGIESNFVENNPIKVSNSKNDWKDPVLLLANDKSGSSGRTKQFWVDRSIIPKGDNYIDLYKVIMTSAYPKQKLTLGNPTIEGVLRRAEELIKVMPTRSAVGRSRLCLFMSESKDDCKRFLKYTQTKFFAGLIIQEPNRTASIGSIVPLQDFTPNSDIDWSKSIPEIDQQLYAKYGLSQEEINFIETRIKEMV